MQFNIIVHQHNISAVMQLIAQYIFDWVLNVNITHVQNGYNINITCANNAPVCEIAIQLLDEINNIEASV